MAYGRLVATHCSTLQHATTSCNTLHHSTTLYSTLQHTDFSGNPANVVDSFEDGSDQLIPHCNTLQRTATHCNTLRHTATHCNTLQHTATLCNTLQHTDFSNDPARIVVSFEDGSDQLILLRDMTQYPGLQVCCSVLQYDVVCCTVLQCAEVCCSVLQCVAVCCSALQCVAACYRGV